MKRIAIALALGMALNARPAFSQRTVEIAWQASPSAAGNPSLTYNVYRASTCAGQFSKVNASAVAATTYLDTTVAVGATYCYQVTAVLNGLESCHPTKRSRRSLPLTGSQLASTAER